MRRHLYRLLSISEVLVLSLLLPMLTAQSVFAAPFTHASIRLERLKAGQATSVLVVVRPATTATEASVTIKFDDTASCFTVAGPTVNVSSAGIPATYNGNALTAWPGIGTTGSVSGGTVTVTSTDLQTTNTYAFFITSGITNGSAGMCKLTLTTRTSAPATIDQTQVATRLVSDDQVIVSAKVPPIFNFQLSANTDSFTADLDPTAVVLTGGMTVQVATNADKGYQVWVKDLNQGLVSATAASYKINTTENGTPDTLTIGQDGYVLHATVVGGTGNGSVTIDPDYTGGANQGGSLSGSWKSLATRTSYTNGDTFTIKEKATISNITPAAADYTDTLTLIGAGLF